MLVHQEYEDHEGYRGVAALRAGLVLGRLQHLLRLLHSCCACAAPPAALLNRSCCARAVRCVPGQTQAAGGRQLLTTDQHRKCWLDVAEVCGMGGATAGGLATHSVI